MPEAVANPPLDGALQAALVAVWARVTNAGGAVGFVGPVTEQDIWPTAEAAFARVADGRDDLVVAFEGGQPLAFGFLVTNEFPLAAHWGTVKRLQRDPRWSGSGVGAIVLRGLEQCAWDRGLERVTLTVRGGTGRERFYSANGYRVDACLPGRLKVAGQTLEEYHMSKTRDPAPDDVRLPVQRLDPDLPLPGYAHDDDAGMDLYAREGVSLAPGERATVPTGLAVAIPWGHVGLVHPRSGLAARHGVALVNSPGTIDAGYRGEVKVVMVNLDPDEAVTVERGDRIAQLVIQRVERASVEEVDELPPSGRGQGGFGSTGR